MQALPVVLTHPTSRTILVTLQNQKWHFFSSGKISVRKLILQRQLNVRQGSKQHLLSQSITLWLHTEQILPVLTYLTFDCFSAILFEYKLLDKNAHKFCSKTVQVFPAVETFRHVWTHLQLSIHFWQFCAYFLLLKEIVPQKRHIKFIFKEEIRYIGGWQISALDLQKVLVYSIPLWAEQTIRNNQQTRKAGKATWEQLETKSSKIFQMDLKQRIIQVKVSNNEKQRKRQITQQSRNQNDAI